MVSLKLFTLNHWGTDGFFMKQCPSLEKKFFLQSYNFNFVVTDDGVVMVDTVFDNSSDEEFVPAVDERVGKFLFFFLPFLL